MKKRIAYIVIVILIIAGIFTFLPAALSCSKGENSEFPDGGIDIGQAALLAQISRLEITSANKSVQIKELDDKVYALEITNINLILENESLRNHIKSLPGEAGYKSITQAWEVCQEQLQAVLPYKERFAELSETWEEVRSILNTKITELDVSLEEVTDNLTICTANLTLCQESD